MIAWFSEADITVLHSLYNARSIAGTYFFIAVSEFGTLWTIAGLTACAVLVLLLRRKYAYALGLAVSTSLVGSMVFLLKQSIALARPDIYYQAYVETGMSFPSGHAAGSIALYGYLAYIARRELPPRISRFVVTTLIVLISLVSFSRLYLGVHYLSDVIGGLAIGALCDGVGILMTRMLARRAN